MTLNRYEIAEVRGIGELHPIGGEAITTREAATARDALADYIVEHGYVDPRELVADSSRALVDGGELELDDGVEWLTVWPPEDMATAPYENTELIAWRPEALVDVAAYDR